MPYGSEFIPFWIRLHFLPGYPCQPRQAFVSALLIHRDEVMTPRGRALEILAHRGWWLSRDERNTIPAFKRAFEAGYGVETDLRDRDGVVVIAHDPATANNITLDDFLDIYVSYTGRPTLALNVKSDGLTALISETLARRGIDDYFVFDMSIPDSLHYLKAGMKTFMRRSEFDPPSPLEARAQGIWLDSFEGAFNSPDEIQACLGVVEAVAIVSPELHGRPHADLWQVWRPLLGIPRAKGQLLLCTDFPNEAKAFFSQTDEDVA